MLKTLVSIFLCWSSFSFANQAKVTGLAVVLNEETSKQLSRLYSPKIEGRTLYIKGFIDGHIYDFLAREDKNIRQNVDLIELNSVGGNAHWALEIAQKIATYKKQTKISKGSFCTSACVILFSAGTSREMEDDTWLGIHTARLGMGLLAKYWNLCFVQTSDGSQFIPTQKGCKEEIQRGYSLALELTNKTFDFMESLGVSPDLKETYYALADDPTWPASGNVVRKPDLVVTKADAIKWNLVVQNQFSSVERMR